MSPKCPACPVTGHCPWDADSCGTAAIDLGFRRSLFHLAGSFAGAVPGSLSATSRAMPPGRGRPDREAFRPREIPPGRRVRVGVWMPCLNIGGGEVWQLAVARAVDPRRVAWVGAAITEGKSNVDLAMREALGSIMPVGFGVKAARRLAPACDVVLSWSTLDIARDLASLSRRPAIVHAAHFPPEHPFPDHIADCLAPVDRWVAVSEVAREWIHPRFRASASIIWNAVDPARLVVRRDRAEMRAAWGVPDGAKVAGFLARFAPEKDAPAMLRLADHLPPGWAAVAVGTGADLGPLRETPHPRLILPGPDAAAGDVVGAFDALIVPSRHESFGLTIAEGLAVGVPMIATTVGILALEPGLVRPIPFGASGREIAAALIADIDDPSGTAARVARGRAFARDRLSLERFGREWTDLLCSAAPADAPPDTFDLAILAELCPSGSGPCGCGGGPPRECGHPEMPPDVRKADCLAHMARDWWEAGVDPAW